MSEQAETAKAPCSGASVLLTVCLAVLVLPLSFSAGAMATPAIAADLGGEPLALSWITNAFMLSFGSSLMVAGALVDRFGAKRLFQTGIASFAVTSLLIGGAPDIVWLDVLRGLQGLASAVTLAGGSAALARLYEGKARTRAFSMLGTTFGVGLAIGPILAGLLLDHHGWRSVFYSGALIGSLVVLFGVPRMRESFAPGAAGFDWWGALIFTVMLAAFTWGVLLVPENGWSSPVVVALLAVSLLLLCLFVVVEGRVDHPMLDLSLFRYPRFVGVQILPVATCYCYVVLLVLLPLRFIGVDRFSETDAGLAMIALSAPMLVMPSLAATLTRWFSPGVLSGVGLLIAGSGIFLLSRVTAGHPSYEVLLPMVVIGTGTGLPWGLMDGLSVDVVPKDRAGMATGIFSTTRVAGEGIALAIVTTLLAAFTSDGLHRLMPVRDAAALHLPAAARHLAIGDVERALNLLPGLGRSAAVSAYAGAFESLLFVLLGITVASAFLVFVILRTPAPAGTEVRPKTEKPAEAGL